MTVPTRRAGDAGPRYGSFLCSGKGNLTAYRMTDAGLARELRQPRYCISRMPRNLEGEGLHYSAGRNALCNYISVDGS